MKFFKNPFVIGWIVLGAVAMIFLVKHGKSQQLDWSPCGNTNLTTNYRTKQGNLIFQHFDDGKRLWRIKGILPPATEGAQPVVEMVQVFERSQENCAIWKMEHGIKD